MLENTLIAMGAWLVMLVMTILNEAFWLQILEQRLGRERTLKLSVISLIPLLSVVAFATAILSDWQNEVDVTSVGVVWIGLTVAFEFLFWRFKMQKSWHEIRQRFDIEEGDGTIWLIILVGILPWIGAFLYWFL